MSSAVATGLRGSWGKVKNTGSPQADPVIPFPCHQVATLSWPKLYLLAWFLHLFKIKAKSLHSCEDPTRYVQKALGTNSNYLVLVLGGRITF